MLDILLENKRLIIAAAVGLLAGAVLLMPLRLINIQLPPSINVKIYKGSILGGNANLFAKFSENSDEELFLLSWDSCLSKSFPFFATCWSLKGADQEHSGDLVGIPGDEIVLNNINSRMPVSVITSLVRGPIAQRLGFLRLRGSLNAEINKLVLDTTKTIPSKWDGRITLNSAGFFNINLPQLVILLSEQPFISSVEGDNSFGAQKLPTIQMQGADDTMDISGTVQFLPDSQMKVSMEILARDPLVAQTFAPLATNRDGNRFFINYQTAL